TDSISMSTYREKLIENEVSLQTQEAIVEMVLSTNKELSNEVTAYKDARNLVDKLLKEDWYDYPEHEQLAEGVTQEDIEEARNKVASLSDDFTEKELLLNNVNYAEYLLNEITDVGSHQ